MKCLMQPLPTGSSSREVAYNIPRAAVPTNPQMPELPECDWSEHTCPDGHKYYYNCVTRESLVCSFVHPCLFFSLISVIYEDKGLQINLQWDKPKEYG